MKDRKNDGSKNGKITVPVVEEDVSISKRDRLKSTYTISKETGLKEHSHELRLLRDTVDIKEVAIDREIGTYPEIRQEGNVTIVPVVEEVEVVRTKLMLVKEVHITKSTSVRNRCIDTRTRFDKITITKDSPKGTSEN